MSIFLELFGNSKEGEIKKLLAETNKQMQKESSSMGGVARLIVQASSNCRDAVKELINAPTEKERQGREIFVFPEVLK